MTANLPHTLYLENISTDLNHSPTLDTEVSWLTMFSITYYFLLLLLITTYIYYHYYFLYKPLRSNRFPSLPFPTPPRLAVPDSDPILHSYILCFPGFFDLQLLPSDLYETLFQKWPACSILLTVSNPPEFLHEFVLICITWILCLTILSNSQVKWMVQGQCAVRSGLAAWPHKPRVAIKATGWISLCSSPGCTQLFRLDLTHGTRVGTPGLNLLNHVFLLDSCCYRV